MQPRHRKPNRIGAGIARGAGWLAHPPSPGCDTFASPKDADGEADGEQAAGVLSEADDDDDEDLDGAVLLKDSDEEDGDVADIRRKEED